MTTAHMPIDSSEILRGIDTDELKDALQMVIAEYHTATLHHGDRLEEPPQVTGIAVVGSVADDSYVEGESDLDIYLFLDDPSKIGTDGLYQYMADDTTFGYGATATVTQPQLTNVDVLGVLETGEMDCLRDPYYLY